MARDIVLLSFLVIAFATLLTVHVALAVALARDGNRRRALAAFFVAPLAPYWGWREGMRARGILWIAAGLSYLGAVWLAMR
jgi:hypothetical protein